MLGSQDEALNGMQHILMGQLNASSYQHLGSPIDASRMVQARAQVVSKLMELQGHVLHLGNRGG